MGHITPGIHQLNVDSDQDVIVNWVADYGKDVWNFVFSLTRNPVIADDIFQDVFVSAYRHMTSFRGDSTVRTWLLKIARNAVLDYRRSALIRRIVLMESPPAGIHASAEDEALGQWVKDRIWTLVLGLPIKLREVLVLYAHHQLSVAEIAGTLRVSEAAVTSRLHRARIEMAKLLKEGGVDVDE